jgi:hypothetical protein
MLRRIILPVSLAIFSLIGLNLGLYMRLSAEPVVISLELPYSEDFTTSDFLQYPRFGGDWDIRDESLVQISTSGFDLGTLIPLQIPAEQAYHFAANLRYIGGSMGGGIIFNSQNGQNRQQSQMARFNVDADKVWLIYGYFGDDSNFTGQGSAETSIASESADWQKLEVYVGQDSYSLAVNGAIIAQNIPLQYHGGTVGLVSSSSQVAFDNLLVETWDGSSSQSVVSAPTTVPTVPVEVTEIPAVANSANLLSDNFDNSSNNQSLWMPFSGQWQFVDGAFVQSQTDGYDLAAGYNQAFGDATVSINFRHLQGQGAGLLFKMEAPDKLQNSQLVRYVPDANYIMWGYFDANGGFQGQGSTEVPAALDASHNLTVSVQNGTYTVSLDGQVLIESVPVMTQGNYYGLVSALSSVAFDDFSVSNVSSVPTEQNPSLDMNAVNGDWEFGDNIIQHSTESLDYIAGTGIAAETFRVSVSITLPVDLPDAGAGLVFHMNGRDDIANGQMIRFGNGGSEIFWGVYDANRGFTGEGGAPLQLDWTNPHRLTLVVRTDSYDVLIDDTTLINNIPVQGSFGWIGLISYRGEVQFSDFALSMGQ